MKALNTSRKISISKDLLQASQNRLTLGVIISKVKVEEETNQKILNLIQSTSQKLKESESSYNNSTIQALKDTYKTLGLKSKYIGSNEALLKRVTADKELYHINTIVDINNYMSIKSLRSIGSYDLDKTSGNIEFRKGNEGEAYIGTTKRSLDLNKLPVLCDLNGPFGSPTSDSDRALVQPFTTNLMMIIFSFDGQEQLKDQIQEIIDLLIEHCNASNLQHYIISEDCVEITIDELNDVSEIGGILEQTIY
jgi:DNA/RNA-binding domain of Phe-tRNA-synthetase-like protein